LFERHPEQTHWPLLLHVPLVQLLWMQLFLQAWALWRQVSTGGWGSAKLGRETPTAPATPAPNMTAAARSTDHRLLGGRAAGSWRSPDGARRLVDEATDGLGSGCDRADDAPVGTDQDGHHSQTWPTPEPPLPATDLGEQDPTGTATGVGEEEHHGLAGTDQVVQTVALS
jgi:hypothetical protein